MLEGAIWVSCKGLYTLLKHHPGATTKKHIPSSLELCQGITSCEGKKPSLDSLDRFVNMDLFQTLPIHPACKIMKRCSLHLRRLSSPSNVQCLSRMSWSHRLYTKKQKNLGQPCLSLWVISVQWAKLSSTKLLGPIFFRGDSPRVMGKSSPLALKTSPTNP